MGMSRKDPKKIENSTIDPRFSNSERTSDDEIKSPVPNSAALAMSNEAVKAAELKAAYTKKAKEEAEAAAAAAAITQMKGPRIRLLPHQHTLFCERKVGAK